MDSDTFVKWLFSPKDSGTMSDPDLSSPSPSESNPTNPPSEPNQAAEELKRLDLQGSCSIEVERASTGDAEDGITGEQVEQVEEGTKGGGEDDDNEEEEKEEVVVEVEVEVEEQGDNGNWSEAEKEDNYSEGETFAGPVEKDTKYPVRPGAVDCPYYMRTGTCKFGYNCRFNHPIAVPRKVHQAGQNEAGHGESAKHNSWQVECKYYLGPGGCKFGNSCNFSHSRTNLAAPTMELNFLGLPIRPGEQECVYFMRTGTCKYGANCRFNHPDPTSTAGGDKPKYPMEYGSSSSRLESPPPPPPQFPASANSWAPPAGVVNESTPRFVPMMYSSSMTQSPKAEWNNGYQFPVNQATSGQSNSMAPRPPYIMHNLTAENRTMHTNNPQQQQHHMVMNEYPERPGQPECTFFMRNGDCKFKLNCKFHHPKERISKPPHQSAAFSNHGLPPRTDQNICTHYSRYGICRFGASCKFDHPVKMDDASRSRRTDHQSSFGSSSRTTSQSGGTWPSSRPQVITL